MRLNNLKEADRRRAQTEPSFLKKVLEEEVEVLKEDLVNKPLEHVPELRGQARALILIIKLLT